MVQQIEPWTNKCLGNESLHSKWLSLAFSNMEYDSDSSVDTKKKRKEKKQCK